MFEWINDNLPAVVMLCGAIFGLITFVWKMFQKWLNLHYMKREEITDLLHKLEESFSEDLIQSSEAGLELSKFMTVQLQTLQSALMSAKVSNND